MRRLLTSEELTELIEYQKSGLRLLGQPIPSEDLLPLIDGWVTSQQATLLKGGDSSLADDHLIDVSWAIGSLLGDRFVKDQHWNWAMIGEGDSERFGIVSPNAALALYPSFFVRDCIVDPSRDFTGTLIFNMVAADQFRDVTAGTCLDLAEQVVRIVPRAPLEV